MTKKMQDAVRKLEESCSADISRNTAVSLYVRGLVNINGYSEGIPAHLNCTLKQKTIFQELR